MLEKIILCLDNHFKTGELSPLVSLSLQLFTVFYLYCIASIKLSYLVFVYYRGQ